MHNEPCLLAREMGMMSVLPFLPSLQVASVNEIYWITPHNQSPFYVHGNILTLKN